MRAKEAGMLLRKVLPWNVRQFLFHLSLKVHGFKYNGDDDNQLFDEHVAIGIIFLVALVVLIIFAGYLLLDLLSV
jgi:hypothetical protein